MGCLDSIRQRRFCFCGSLRTGTLIGAVAAIILAIVGIIVLLTVRIEIRTIVLDWLGKQAVLIIVIINFCMTIIISLLMIIGTVKRNMYLMIPYVILGIMLAFGILVSVLYTGIKLLIDGANDENEVNSRNQTIAGVIWLVFGILAFIIYTYMWLIAYSYFCIIKDETNRGRYTKDPFRRKY